MTIYKPKTEERKVAKKESPSTKIVIADDVQPLAVKSKKAEAAVNIVVLPKSQQRRQGAAVACLTVLLIIVILVVFVGGFWLYHHVMTKVPNQLMHMKTAEIPVRYYEYKPSDEHGEHKLRQQIHGSFIEEFEIDSGNSTYERLNVPPILDSRRSTVVHDFEKNLTAIVDRDRERCFVMPLNRTTVKPPRSLFDLLMKYQSGYYFPDAEVIRDEFKVLLPAVDDLGPFGFYIWLDCRSYQTYRLVHDDTELRFVSKRSACEMAGDKYCLGDAGTDKMLCFTLSGCI
jgi:hypothetical protein